MLDDQIIYLVYYNHSHKERNMAMDLHKREENGSFKTLKMIRNWKREGQILFTFS